MSQQSDPARHSWRETIGFCARYWGQEKPLLSVVIVLTVAMVIAEVCIPLSAGHLVDTLTKVAAEGLTDQRAGQAALLAVAVMTGTSALYYVLGNISTRVYHQVAARCMAKVLEDGFARIQHFSSDWHANTFAGATVHKLTRGRWSYEHISDILWQQFLPLGLVILGLAGVMLVRFPMVGIVFLVMVAVYVIASFVIAIIYVRPANVVAAAADSRIGAAVADAVSNNNAVKAYGAEARETERFEQVTGKWRSLAIVSWRRALDMGLVQHALWLTLQAAMLVLLIGLSMRGQATPGDVAFVITANFQLGGSLRKVGDHIRMLQRASAELADIIEFDRAPLGVEDIPKAAEFQRGRGEIIFDQVQFNYPGAEMGKPSLYHNLDLRIAPGEKIALVGPSGSGKSTFVKLIQRLYDLQAGTIWIDGQDIAQVRQASLRRAISIVPQEPILFHRSLADNIAYAHPHAPMEAIIQAAKRAFAHDFIQSLPEGYQTLVGERGVKLSGGERQRVAIARAFLADANIVIFDEATSSLDTVTERLIQAAMADLMVNRTTIIVAHRLSTIKDVDRILVFDRGKIIEQGHHKALLAIPEGTYARLHAVHMDDQLIG